MEASQKWRRSLRRGFLLRQWRLLLPGNGQDQKKSDKTTVAQRPRKTWSLRSAISVSILAFSAVDENGKANLSPKN